MALYIKGTGNISPQKTWDGKIFSESLLDYKTNRLSAHEPDYAALIDPKQLRRMSRIIRMAVASSSMALKEAGLSAPDSIITGTGYGCLDDTGIFLTRMIENKEVALNPTPFIQSTHNTMGSQIALMLQCQGYNQTYAHGAFSFESALLDALMQAEENPNLNILLGAIDEVTDVSHKIQSRFGIFRHTIDSSLSLVSRPGDGTINGEASVFFAGSGERSNAFGCISHVQTWYNADRNKLRDSLRSLAADFKPDIILSGACGNQKLDRDFNSILNSIVSAPVAHFKHLCGEFPVASAFGCWLGLEMIKRQSAHPVLDYAGPLKNILVLNQYFGTHYSAIALQGS